MGVDACRAGWIGIVLDDSRGPVAHVSSTVTELIAVAEAGGVIDVVAIDIPIGLPDAGRRRADELARSMVGARAASVFMTPVRRALEAGSHVDAVRINRELAGEGTSIQAYGLRARILEVDRWIRQPRRRTVETHPELAFALMAGAPLGHAKTTLAGLEARGGLLRQQGIVLAGDLRPAGTRVDDVLDAAAAAWSARRVAAGTALCLPDPPETFTDGWPCAIWA
jgi:predicted RNase H-like nuclease